MTTTKPAAWTTIADFIDHAWDISRADRRQTREAELDAIRTAGARYGLPSVHGFQSLAADASFTGDCESYLAVAAHELSVSLRPDRALTDTIGAQLAGVTTEVWAWMEGDPGHMSGSVL